MSEKEKYVLITAKEYIELLKSEEELSRLEASGVDNWCGYGEGEFETTFEEDVEQMHIMISHMTKYDEEGKAL